MGAFDVVPAGWRMPLYVRKSSVCLAAPSREPLSYAIKRTRSDDLHDSLICMPPGPGISPSVWLRGCLIVWPGVGSLVALA